MNIQRYQASSEGWPGVRWEQLVPSAETLASRRRRWRWRLAWVAGLAFGWGVWAYGDGVFSAVVAGLALTLVLLAPEAWRALSFDFGSAGSTKPLEPTEDERAARARAQVKRGEELELCRAEVEVPAGSKTPRLVLWRKGRGEEQQVFEIPLESFDELQLDTAQTWFGDAASAEMRRLGHAPEQWVIVAVTKGYGVMPLARSGGGKAGIAELHLALVEDILGDRREILQRAQELRKGLPAEMVDLPSAAVGRAAAQREAALIRASLAGTQSTFDRLSDNPFFGFLLRAAARLRDVVVSWVLGMAVLLLFLGWIFGAFQGASVWNIKWVKYVFDRPAYDKEVKDEAAAVKKQAAAAAFAEDVKTLEQMVRMGFNPGRLPRNCANQREELVKRIDDITAKYAELLERWKAIEGIKGLGNPGHAASTGEYMERDARFRNPDPSQVGWVIEMLGEDSSSYASRNYYPPDPAYIRRSLILYIERLCINGTNSIGK